MDVDASVYIPYVSLDSWIYIMKYIIKSIFIHTYFKYNLLW